MEGFISVNQRQGRSEIGNHKVSHEQMLKVRNMGENGIRDGVKAWRKSERDERCKHVLKRR